MTSKFIIGKADGLFTLRPVYEFFKAHLSSEKVINKYSGDIIEFPQSTAEMDTATFSAYCEKLRDYASEYLGIDIPDPDKYWRMEGRS